MPKSHEIFGELAYYEVENSRWGFLLDANWVDKNQLDGVLEKCCRKFLHGKKVALTVDLKPGFSHATEYEICLCEKNWLTFAHEFAHIWHEHVGRKGSEKWHGPTHRKMVDAVCIFLIKTLW